MVLWIFRCIRKCGFKTLMTSNKSNVVLFDQILCIAYIKSPFLMWCDKFLYYDKRWFIVYWWCLLSICSPADCLEIRLDILLDTYFSSFWL